MDRREPLRFAVGAGPLVVLSRLPGPPLQFGYLVTHQTSPNQVGINNWHVDLYLV